MTLLPVALGEAARAVIERHRRAGQSIATAESCTGGLVAAALTSVPGSSAVLERGFVTYSNQSKTEMLGVDATLIATHGAVSDAVARAMAEGALAHARGNVAVAITGIAGPDGGSADKPVGLVHFALSVSDQPTDSYRMIFAGDRDHIRLQAALFALGLLNQAVP